MSDIKLFPLRGQLGVSCNRNDSQAALAVDEAFEHGDVVSAADNGTRIWTVNMRRDVDAQR